MIFSGPALALDPHRALTQALLRKWQFQQGLPQATIFTIRQTTDGYLWLGSQSGLFRFDGLRFVAAHGGSGISLNNLWIEDLCEDREHYLWIATNDAGLVRLKQGMAVQFGRAEGLPSMHVSRLLLDRLGDLWAGTDGGLARWTQDRFIQASPRRPMLTSCPPIVSWIVPGTFCGSWARSLGRSSSRSASRGSVPEVASKWSVAELTGPWVVESCRCSSRSLIGSGSHFGRRMANGGGETGVGITRAGSTVQVQTAACLSGGAKALMQHVAMALGQRSAAFWLARTRGAVDACLVTVRSTRAKQRQSHSSLSHWTRR